MELSNSWGLNLIAVSLFVAYWYLTTPNNLPPGTSGFPIVGSLFNFDRKTVPTLTKLKKKYGSINYMYFGNRLAIFLNDFEAVKEAFLKQGTIFAGRPASNFEAINDFFSGVIFSDGDYWKQHRRFILHNLRDYGVGKPTLEPLLIDEISHFLKEINKHAGNPMDFRSILAPSLSNNIHLLVTGKRYDYDNPLIKDMVKAGQNIDDMNVLLAFTTFLPWAKPIFKVVLFKVIQKAKKINDAYLKLIEKVLGDAKKNFVNGQSENYLQSYLTERQKRLETNKNENIFTEEGLFNNTRDLLFVLRRGSHATFAGTDTSATTLSWAAIYLAVHPNVQKRIQEEIKRVIGDREPTYNDRVNTPYTEATIWEIHRIASIIPAGIPHRTFQETTLYGYTIPKDTYVYAGIWTIHHCPKLWGDPENFRPDRFLNSDGEFVKPEYLIPFSIGKRACAGEALARMELYLYFVSLLQNFEFAAPENEKLSFESEVGPFRIPKSKRICVKPRKL